MVNVKYNTFAAAVLWDTNKWRYPYSPGEMLQRYIRALADPSVIVLIIPREWHPLGAVARMGSAPSFLVIALRNVNSSSQGVANKRCCLFWHNNKSQPEVHWAVYDYCLSRSFGLSFAVAWVDEWCAPRVSYINTEEISKGIFMPGEFSCANPCVRSWGF